MDILVLGIGNVLLTDEGIGVRALKELERKFSFPANVELLDGGTAGIPWRQVWPQGIPFIQAAVLLAGFGYTLRNGYRTWREEAGARAAALRGFVPQAALLTALTTWLIVFHVN